MDSKDIDWDEVMKDWDVWIERTRLVEEQIRKERQKPITAEEFVKAQERALKFLKENIRKKKQHYILKNRWSGFAQNLAHFVNMNTDVALITLFMPLQYVSVYTVHLLVINALRGIVTSVGNSYQSALGKYIAMGDSAQLKQKCRKFEEGFWLTGMVLFFCCTLLINPFI